MAVKNKSFADLNHETSALQQKHEKMYNDGKIPKVPLTIGKSKPNASSKKK